MVASVLYRKCTLELSWSGNNCTVSQYIQYMCRERERERGLLTDDIVDIQVYCDTQARLKQPTIEGFLLPKWVGIQTDIQTVTPPPLTNLTQEDNSFEEHESTTSPRIPLIQEVTVEDSRGSNTGGTPGTEVGTSTIRSASLPVTPSLVELTTSNGQEPCSFQRGGMCSTHNRVGTRSIKQTKCWKKKKDGSFGYITSKKVVYTCEFNEMRKPVIPVSCVISETDGDPNNGSNSDALLGLSSDLEVELSDRKMSESLPPD